MKLLCLVCLSLFSTSSFSQTLSDPQVQLLLNRPEARKCREIIARMDHVEVYQRFVTYTRYDIIGLISNQYVTVVLTSQSRLVTGIGGAGQVSTYTCSVINDL